jgi:hypothetical protein
MLDLSAERLAPFAVEWETGNIASSHRAMNKMALTLKQGRIAGGVLVLPSRALYRYLTDRMGNYEELEPYFGLYTDLEVDRGYLGVVVVEHDAVSADVPKIRKGTDGRALVYKRVTPAQDAPDRDHEPSLWPRRQGSWLRPAPLRLSTGG